MMQSEEQQLTARQQEQNDFERLMNLPRIKPDDVTSVSMMFDPLISRRIQSFAKMMAEGTVTVPEHLRGNIGDCLAIAMQAAAWRLNPFLVAQKTHLIHGKLGYEAQLVSAITSSLGLLDGRFQYTYEGDWRKIEKRPKIVKGSKGPYPEPGWNSSDEEGLAIIVTGTIRGDEEPRTHRLAMATIWPRNSTLWATAPQQQIAYLATKQWVRKYAPDAILGVYTPDEIQQEIAAPTEVSDASNGIMDEARTLETDTEPDTDEEWPQTIEGNLVDARGIPWHESFYSRARTCNDDGSWRRRRGASHADIERYERAFDATHSGRENSGQGQSEAGDAINPDDLRKLINDAKSSADLSVLIDMVEYQDIPQEQKEDLIDLAVRHRADWLIVEREDPDQANA